MMCLGLRTSAKDLARTSFGTMAMFKTPYHKHSSSAARPDIVSSAEPGIVIGYEPRTPSNLRVFFPLTHTVGTRKPGPPVVMPSLIDALNAMDSKEKAALDSIAPVSDDQMTSLIPYDDQLNVSIDHLQEQYRFDLELGPLPSTSLLTDSPPPYASAQELAPPGRSTQSQSPSLPVEPEIFEESDDALDAIDFSTPASQPYDADSTLEYESDHSDADDTAAYRSDLPLYDADDIDDYRSDHDANVVAPTSRASTRGLLRSRTTSSSTPLSSPSHSAPSGDAATIVDGKSAVGRPTSGFRSSAPTDVASSSTLSGEPPPTRASSRLATKPRVHVSDLHRAYIITAAQAWGGTLPLPVLDAHKDEPLYSDERQALALMIQETSNMSIAQAKRAIQASQVDHAVATELHNIVKRETWRLVKPSAMTLDERKKIIPSKLFLKLKLKANGAIAKLKARLVAGGHRQHPDTFSRTSSPTIDTSHIFLALSIAATYGWDLATLDVPSAYLNADIPDIVHMRLDKDVSKVFVDIFPQFKDLMDEKGSIIVQLLKALYGLKQAGAAWNDNITDLLKRLGFTQSLVDKCWFYKGQGADATIVLLHVDDLLILTKDIRTRTALLKAMKEAYGEDCELHTGSIIEYLGMQIERILNPSGFKVWQPGYTSRSTENYTPDSRTYSTPSTADFFDTLDDPNTVYPAEYAYEFQSHLATLLYLACHTRPDILKECVFLASHIMNPGPIARAKLNRLYGYLRATPDLGIFITGGDLQLTVYTDASYAVHRNGRSHSALVISLGMDSGPVMVKSKAQPIVTTSSTEAEIQALFSGVQKVSSIYRILLEIGIHHGIPIRVLQDNISAITIAKGGEGYGGKSRHMRVRYQYLCEMSEDGVITFVHCPTDRMIADLCTKPIGGNQFRYLRSKLLNIPQTSEYSKYLSK